MKRLISSALVTYILLASGCGTYQVSENISEDGKGASKIIFPKKEDAWKKEGIFPNLENLGKIDKGMTKEALYYLLGAPHFSEAHNSGEWDYIFKFRNPITRDVSICQYKVLFDKDKKGQSFYWLPENCADKLQVTTPTGKTSLETPNIKVEVISLDTDALFYFNKSQLVDIKPAGRNSLLNLAKKIKQYRLKNQVELELVGHTDRLGSQSYNQALSLQRAATVKAFLVQQGIPDDNITAQGVGKSQPISQCFGIDNRKALIGCLQPDRRVEVTVKRY